MNNYQQRRLNSFRAELAFMQNNAADFPAASIGDKIAKSLAEAVTQISALSGEQRSNLTRQHTSVKSDKLQQLIELLQKMNRAANAMADEINGIENLFRMPRRRSIEIWIATARAFYNDSAGYEADFKDYFLPEGFRADLLALIGEIQNASTAADAAGAQRAGATGGMVELFRQAGSLSNRLDSIVRNRYAADAQKLAA